MLQLKTASVFSAKFPPNYQQGGERAEDNFKNFIVTNSILILCFFLRSCMFNRALIDHSTFVAEKVTPEELYYYYCTNIVRPVHKFRSCYEPIMVITGSARWIS